MNQQDKQPRSSQDNRRIRHLILFVTLFLAFLAFVFLCQPPQRPSTTSKQTTAPLPSNYGSTYYYGGMPRPSGTFSDSILVLTNTGYVVGYCEARRNPVWACYRLFKVDNLHAPPRPQGFTMDMRTEHPRVASHHYSGTGYDRGHMAPNYAIAVCYGQQAQEETFKMSNIIPQTPKLNRQVWERLERQEIKIYAQRYRQLWVVDGPIFNANPKTIQIGIAVPSACYKILIEEENCEPKLLTFIIPQAVEGTELPQDYLSTIGEVEKETGLSFFSDLPKTVRDRLKTEKAWKMW